MSKTLSLKMDEAIFRETERVTKQLRLPRNAYINRAVAFYNRCQKRFFLKKQLRRDVDLLQEETRTVVQSTELLEDLPE